MSEGLVQVGQETVHESWRPMLEREAGKPYFAALQRAVQADRLQGAVYPPRGMVLAALRTPLEAVRCVILGQDPYHGTARLLRPAGARGGADGAHKTVPQACGLAFSVPPGCQPPPSLRVIVEELREDLVRLPRPELTNDMYSALCRQRGWTTGNGDLSPWARQGVLLLNTALTVRAGSPKSHAWQSTRQPGVGWEEFTDAVCREVLAQDRPVAWLLWGSDARRKLGTLLGQALPPTGAVEDCTRNLHASDHLFLCAPHPSPANLHASFRGSRPFSQTNDWLRARGTETVDWSLAAPDGGSP